jgi:hypothetical protein
VNTILMLPFGFSKQNTQESNFSPLAVFSDSPFP